MADSRLVSPLVSIVLPTYKRAELLPFAIRSVLAQTYSNWELIIVDDNSPDTTAEVVGTFTDPRIRYLRNETNLKLPRSLNRGFGEARGELLTWTSDDNVHAPAALERMAAVMQARACDFVYADYYEFSETATDGTPLDPSVRRLPDTLRLEQGNHIGACFLYSRKVYERIGDYDPELFLVEDYDYFLRAAREFSFCHLNEPLYYFRRDDATLYCSRYPEVKASDVLVRFKNGSIDVSAAAFIFTDLLAQHPADLQDAGLRRAFSIRKHISFRLGAWLFKRRRARLQQRLVTAIAPVFAKYQAEQLRFDEARTALLDCVRMHGRLAYVAPRN